MKYFGIFVTTNVAAYTQMYDFSQNKISQKIRKKIFPKTYFFRNRIECQMPTLRSLYARILLKNWRGLLLIVKMIVIIIRRNLLIAIVNRKKNSLLWLHSGKVTYFLAKNLVQICHVPLVSTFYNINLIKSANECHVIVIFKR